MKLKPFLQPPLNPSINVDKHETSFIGQLTSLFPDVVQDNYVVLFGYRVELIKAALEGAFWLPCDLIRFAFDPILHYENSLKSINRRLQFIDNWKQCKFDDIGLDRLISTIEKISLGSEADRFQRLQKSFSLTPEAIYRLTRSEVLKRPNLTTDKVIEKIALKAFDLYLELHLGR